MEEGGTLPRIECAECQQLLPDGVKYCDTCNGTLAEVGSAEYHMWLQRGRASFLLSLGVTTFFAPVALYMLFRAREALDGIGTANSRVGKSLRRKITIVAVAATLWLVVQAAAVFLWYW